ncbi:unnamed protein product [Periconia digitata]|uniref:Uncharacterized protein n=1 Tax=Periconia digitata TaxID=1303443 RepID=A0A9W4XM26_9PLEO|nr:unnamed protein product [Periconia digitata]
MLPGLPASFCIPPIPNHTHSAILLFNGYHHQRERLQCICVKNNNNKTNLPSSVCASRIIRA